MRFFRSTLPVIAVATVVAGTWASRYTNPDLTQRDTHDLQREAISLGLSIAHQDSFLCLPDAFRQESICAELTRRHHANDHSGKITLAQD